jgi:ABC-2 type transport system ATP-binding protein
MAHSSRRCHRRSITPCSFCRKWSGVGRVGRQTCGMTTSAASTAAPSIEAHGLAKQYGSAKKGLVHALAGLDLVAPAGKVTAILGPNGAGKTTFVKAVATLLRPDAGSLTVAGIDAIAHPEQVRRVIGLAGQNAAVEPALTGRENLVMIARLFGHDAKAAKHAATAVLAEIHLEDDADRPVKGYSGGMRRRLDLGASLVGSPRILLLDEPTTGLDPRTRIELWESIRSLVAGGTDVLLTTQYLEEADQLADHIVIIDHGRSIATGTPTELKSQAGRDVVEVRVAHGHDLAAIAEIIAPLGTEAPHLDEPARRVAVPVADGTNSLATAVRLISERGIELDDIGLRRPTLDEVFLALTGTGAPE